jgi:beta-aspartyl-peptidase (threonine type)
MTGSVRNNGLGGRAVVVAAMVLGGCAGGSGHAGFGRPGAAGSEIPAIIARQADAWNRGDIDGFMDAYWRSPELTFSSGGTVVRGWDGTLDRYRRRYPDRKAMGQLKFFNLELIPLGRDAALVLGKWRLDRADAVGGTFTLIWRRIDGRWVIVHDHTSAAAQ